ncbi:MAG: NAD(P)H-dependent oxidoreductase [Proteobacteria bacterium]|nr:NAD(P)H-dependent oxidoreductase [Pseudomonadota bacterium]
MKIGIICGSHRPVSESGKIARHIEKELVKQGICDATWLFDLGGNPLPLWDEGIWSDDPEWQKILGPLAEEVISCDAFVVVSPEYHGMVPAGLKNFLLMWAGGGEMAHKPALIVTVSASDGGSYPVAELRMSSYKNNRLCYLPEHLIIRKVAGVFNDDAEKNDVRSQPYYEKRLAYCLDLLGEYASAFRQIRASGKASLENYSSGM